MEGTEAGMAAETSQGVESAPAAPAAVETGSPTESAPATEQTVPYTRFQEVNDAKNAAQEQLRQYQAQMLATPQPTQTPQVMPSEQSPAQAQVFDAETQAMLNSWYENQVSQDPRFKKVEEAERIARDANQKITLQQFRQEIDGFADNEDEALKLYGKIAEEGFGGKTMAKLLADAVRAQRGDFREQGKQEALSAQTMRLQASGPPSGAAPGATEQPKGLADMTLEQRDALRKSNLRKAALRTD